MYIADLHIHSRYSRATSKDCVPEYLELWARKKGIDLLGTGDFTHPAWRQELSDKLEPAEDGLYRLKEAYRIKDRAPVGNGLPRFVVSGEISSIYKKNGRVRKVHNLILLPGLEEAERLAGRLETIGNIHSDGRPILGLDSRDLLEITLEVCPKAIFVPAHIWTPHFSMFGAFSGFDTVEECFEDLTPYIRAFETGLSSDPPMNWRVSALDRFQMLSHSDAHSPGKLGREADLLEISMSYEGLYDAVQEGRGLAGTIEFFPEEGKYHYDGHRKCHLCLSPREANAYQGKCPVCGKKLTLGVSHRIEQLADREEGFVRPEAAPFESLVPLPEVIASSMGLGSASAKVQRRYEEMLAKLGMEFEILRQVPVKTIRDSAGGRIAEGIRRLREGKVRRFPGFDGEYGTIQLFAPSELEDMEGQMSLFSGMGIASGGLSEVRTDGGEQRGRAGQAEGREQTDGDRSRSAAATGVLPAAGRSGSEKIAAASDGKAAAGPDKTIVPAGHGNVPAADLAVTLDEGQIKAVRSIVPRIAVIAGPGTGKTRTLVAKICYLLQERRVAPADITAVTFTRKAAREMEERLEAQLGKRSRARKVRVGTFHGLCYDQLRAMGEDFSLAGEDVAQELVREAAKELGIKKSPRTLRQMISRRKVEMAETGRTAEQETRDMDRLLERYQERLASLHALDLDDLLLEALKRAEQEDAPPVPYLLVDEFQDISPLQYRLIRAWSRGGRELFIIGDPDQAIYGFRGAAPEVFGRFCREESTEVACLRRNYRSTPQILDASAAVLKAAGRLKPMQGPGPGVRLVEAVSEKAEAVFVAKEIRRMIGGIDMLDAQEGGALLGEGGPRSFSDIAVLYRSHRQAGLLEECLQKEGIPYLVTGREDFLEEDKVRGSLHFFKSLLDEKDRLSRKLCLRLLWDVGEEELSTCPYDALAEKYRGRCRKGDPVKVWALWRKDVGLMEDEAMEKLAAMAVFCKNMEEMLNLLAMGKESDLRRAGGRRYSADMVTLMTMHASKGLEFPAVFLYGIREGVLPPGYVAGDNVLSFDSETCGGTLPPSSRTDKAREAEVEEERRLLYVAMTRAREELILTTSGEPSVFLRQVPEGTFLKEQAKPRVKEPDGGHQMSLFELWPTSI